MALLLLFGTFKYLHVNLLSIGIRLCLICAENQNSDVDVSLISEWWIWFNASNLTFNSTSYGYSTLLINVVGYRSYITLVYSTIELRKAILIFCVWLFLVLSHLPWCPVVGSKSFSLHYFMHNLSFLWNLSSICS